MQILVGGRAVQVARGAPAPALLAAAGAAPGARAVYRGAPLADCAELPEGARVDVHLRLRGGTMIKVCGGGRKGGTARARGEG